MVLFARSYGLAGFVRISLKVIFPIIHVTYFDCSFSVNIQFLFLLIYHE